VSTGSSDREESSESHTPSAADGQDKVGARAEVGADDRSDNEWNKRAIDRVATQVEDDSSTAMRWENEAASPNSGTQAHFIAAIIRSSASSFFPA
jgi:hypothetical protein